MQADDIRDMIKAGLPDAEVTVGGEDGVHFEAVVVSPSFAGKRTLERHRMVYATLGEKMGDAIHALSMQTVTPEEKRD
ncbi:MAG: BolA/IbaG family iron-sulfur metabolism protein [Proteobacteria bacterium]|nr:BolA/IbaG family iron-sulfur metabolism protein [Pseudomonadota bacterium]